MRHAIHLALLVCALVLLGGCVSQPASRTLADPSCARQADCDDWAQLRGRLEPLLRGNKAEVTDAGGTMNSPHRAYLRLKSAFYHDPQFNCRQPLTARYLASVWQLDDQAGRCDKPLPFRVRGLASLDSVRWIDPSRVQAVHLLFMGQSGQSFSRFGHVAVRLIVCSPRRTVVGPKCEEDIQEHIVLSFSASIADPQISVWKGVAGGYAIGLFASDFHDVYQQYTIDEFRSLSSVPMNLSEQEKSLLIQGLAETHWSYSNDYRFFSHNCASELQWLLNMAIGTADPDAAPLGAQPRVRPDKLFADALAHPAFRSAVLDDLKLAEHQGYYFPSAEPYLQYAYGVFAARLQNPSPQTPDSSERWYEAGAEYRAGQLQHLLQHPAGDMPKTLDAFLVLETWSARRLQRALMNALFIEHRQELLEASRSWKTATDSGDSLRRCLASLLLPEVMSGTGEGIPQSASVQVQSRCDAGSTELTRGFKGLLDQLLHDKGLAVQYQTGLDEIQMIGKNIAAAQHQRAVLASLSSSKGKP